MPQNMIAGSGVACGAAAMLAQAAAHPDQTILQYVQLGGTGGLIVCLIFAIKYLTKKNDDKDSKIVQLLETAVASNTTALAGFEREMREAKKLNTLQSDKICKLLQEILYEFRDNEVKPQLPQHGHDKKS